MIIFLHERLSTTQSLWRICGVLIKRRRPAMTLTLRLTTHSRRKWILFCFLQHLNRKYKAWTTKFMRQLKPSMPWRQIESSFWALQVHLNSLLTNGWFLRAEVYYRLQFFTFVIFYYNSIAIYLSDLKTMTDVAGNPEEERHADFYYQGWSQEAVCRYRHYLFYRFQLVFFHDMNEFPF